METSAKLEVELELVMCARLARSDGFCCNVASADLSLPSDLKYLNGQYMNAGQILLWLQTLP